MMPTPARLQGGRERAEELAEQMMHQAQALMAEKAAMAAVNDALATERRNLLERLEYMEQLARGGSPEGVASPSHGLQACDLEGAEAGGMDAPLAHDDAEWHNGGVAGRRGEDADVAPLDWRQGLDTGDRERWNDDVGSDSSFGGDVRLYDE